MAKYLSFNKFPKYDSLEGFTPYYDKGKTKEEQKKEPNFIPNYIIMERPTPITELSYLTTHEIIERKNKEK